MKYLLDTNVVSGLLSRRPDLVRRVRLESAVDVATSAIVAHELFLGAYKGRQTSKNLRTMEEFPLSILEFDVEDARRAGEIRAYLNARGTPIGAYDVLIAGQALARNLTLVTNNAAEFSRVPDLLIEDWQAA